SVVARGGGVPVPGDGGLLRQLRDRKGRARPHPPLPAPAVYPGRRHDAGRIAVVPAARALWDLPPPGFLLGRRPGDGGAALGLHSGYLYHRGWRDDDRPLLARDPP